ncbi:GNAT family N-acetyltransferase [Brevundimonas staleyi]|uniref:GNAT family N-acetyltransferase n=1 Tax=Brevundimonas staleyi TaxID=74326 RepID=A0ABW0FR01_9CAUL
MALVDRTRAKYESYQPIFWRRGPDHLARTRCYFRFQILNPRTKTLVCERGTSLVGCLVALPTPAPPIFNPGGPTVTIDDFCVSRDEEWAHAGRALIEKLRQIAERKGWHQLVAVNAAADLPKARFLEGIGLSIASTWSVGTFDRLVSPGTAPLVPRSDGSD